MGMESAADAILFDVILHKMFEAVGETYSHDFVAQKDWYHLRSWTEDQEKDFKSWMVAYMRKICHWSKKVAEREASWWLIQYGWKTVPNGLLIVQGVSGAGLEAPEQS